MLRVHWRHSRVGVELLRLASAAAVGAFGAHAMLLEVIGEIHHASQRTYEARRIHAELVHGRGVAVARCTVELVIRRNGLAGLPGRHADFETQEGSRLCRARPQPAVSRVTHPGRANRSGRQFTSQPGAAGHLRRRRRGRLSAAGRRRGQPRADAQRSVVRRALRGQPHRGVIRAQGPPPAQPRRQPLSQQRAVAHRHRAAACR